MNQTNNYTVEEESKGFFIIREEISKNNGAEERSALKIQKRSLNKTDYEKLISNVFRSLKKLY